MMRVKPTQAQMLRTAAHAPILPQFERSALPSRACRNRSRAHHKQRPHASIRDFIQNECPTPGRDRVYREQPRDATVEAELLMDGDHMLQSPGCTFDTSLPLQSFSRVASDGGQVILARPGEQSKPMSKGSTATLAQVVASQKVGTRAHMRVVVQQRVLIQAVSAGVDGAQRAQAAVLNDRWVYYTRAGAVEEAAASAGGCPPGPDQGPQASTSGSPSSAAAHGPEVLTALTDCLDAAKEVLTLMQHLSQLCQQLSDGAPPGGPDEALLAAAAEEWESLLRWAHSVECNGERHQLHAPSSAQQPGSSSVVSEQGGSVPADGVDGAAGAAATVGVPGAAATVGVLGAAATVGGPGAGGQVAFELQVAMRMSYAPFASSATPLLLGASEVEVEGRRRKAMEATDAGSRLEEAAEYLQQLKGRLSARLALAGM